MGRRLGLSTLVVMLSLLFWAWTWGPVGALLSVPLTMVVKIFLENTRDLRWVAVLLDKKAPDQPSVVPMMAPAEPVSASRPPASPAPGGGEPTSTPAVPSTVPANDPA